MWGEARHTPLVSWWGTSRGWRRHQPTAMAQVWRVVVLLCVAFFVLANAAPPTARPSMKPSMKPTMRPSSKPTARPTRLPTGSPTSRPTSRCVFISAFFPSLNPSLTLSHPSFCLSTLTRPLCHPTPPTLTRPSCCLSIPPNAVPRVARRRVLRADPRRV